MVVAGASGYIAPTISILPPSPIPHQPCPSSPLSPPTRSPSPPSVPLRQMSLQKLTPATLVCHKYGHRKQMERMIQSCSTFRCSSGSGSRRPRPLYPVCRLPIVRSCRAQFGRSFVTANPKNSNWFNRDRFVLSNGYVCVYQGPGEFLLTSGVTATG